MGEGRREGGTLEPQQGAHNINYNHSISQLHERIHTPAHALTHSVWRSGSVGKKKIERVTEGSQTNDTQTQGHTDEAEVDV